MSHRSSIAAAIALVAAGQLHAQVPPWRDTTFVPPRCLAPDGKPPRAPSLVHLVPGVPVEPFAIPPKAAEPAIDLASEVLARYMRGFLGAPDGALPGLDTTRDAIDYSGWAVVVAHRDGRMRALMPWDLAPRRVRAQMHAVTGGKLLALLERAVDSASVSDPFTWPEDLEGDSIAFQLRFDWPRPDGAGHFDPIPARHAAPVVPAVVSAMRPARPARPSDFVFRRWPGERNEDVEVEVAFVIDTSGKPEPESIRDLWPSGKAPPTGLAARSYAEFTTDLRRSIERDRYTPARVGRCVVRAPYKRRIVFGYGEK